MPTFDPKQVRSELDRLVAQKFYGRVEIRFDAGKIIQVLRVESLAPLSQEEVLRITITEKSE